MWTERDIKEQTNNEQTFYRGKLLEGTNGILNFSTFKTEGIYGDPELNLRSSVRGSNKQNYDVEITLFLTIMKNSKMWNITVPVLRSHLMMASANIVLQRCFTLCTTKNPFSLHLLQKTLMKHTLLKQLCLTALLTN